MTLVLAAVTGHYAIHASDRYTSVRPTRKHPTPDWDIHANKTVVAIGSDCWLVLGFSGLAYLDDKPTDQLIAEAISGYDDLSGSAAFIPWIVSPQPHYRDIRDRVERKLVEAYSRLPRSTARDYATSVLAAGVQRKDNSIYGVMFKIVTQGKNSIAQELAPSKLRWNQVFTQAIGSRTRNIDITNRAKQRILSDAGSPEEVRNILMDAVSESSKVDSSIGPDIMGVILNKKSNTISTYFRASDPRRQAEIASIVSPDDERAKHIPTVATPYVLEPGMIFGPSVAPPGGWPSNNGITFEFSGFGVEPAASKDGGTFIYVAGQPRKPPPK
ncbi:Uncharacterised protein [Mycolicibacterium aurum]|uniref:Uncharacterized protein n=1 Tax=Mycolicibacterium aurum TaxID=1791 RepID=A0A3S4VRG8_MYCAU|nr:hypothetical protein [Mycolicibacterium aurum]VEG57086.1 Uncharacterised protein [Mycolicibacterium aurum]